jgi:hypothetical protein
VEVAALTDHNAAFNGPAFAVNCAREGVLPLFGLELNPREEAHLLVLFAAPRLALEFARRVVAPLLPPVPLRSDVFGDQVVVDADDNILSFYDLWLGSALDAGFDELARLAAQAGALVVPAHVDRPAMSVYSQLGFLPAGPYDAVESIGPIPDSLSGDYAVISDSDAHYPEHIARRPFQIELPDEQVAALRNALSRFARHVLPTGELSAREFSVRAPSTSHADEASPDMEISDSGILPSSLFDILLMLDSVRNYPEEAALGFMSVFRTALREKKVKPTHVSRPSGLYSGHTISI